MPEFDELVERYDQRRKKDTVVDSVTAGASYVDNVAAGLGVLENTGLLDAATIIAPIAVIAATEEYKVIKGYKTGKAGLADGLSRACKTGAAMGAGLAASAICGTPIVAVPVAAGVRALLRRYQSRAFLAARVESRIERMKALREQQEEKRSLED